MADLITPDKATLAQWLRKANIESYECDQCAGLHLSALQHAPGVVDARLFVENYGLLFSTELEVRPMAMLPIAADLGRLNMDYPALKLFLDVVDEAVPQLVAGATLLTGAGVSPAQVANFIATVSESIKQLASECRHLDYLYLVDERGDQLPPHQPVH